MTDGEGWEARMAERANERALVRDAEEIAREAAESEVEAGRPVSEEAVAAYLVKMPMTEAEAREVEPFACACMGPPPELSGYVGDVPCRCQLLWMKVRQVLGDDS